MRYKPLFFCPLGALLLLGTLTACQDEDFGYTAERIAYESNFRDFFGTVDKDQTWDLSSYNLSRLGLEGGPSGDTRAGAAGSNYTGSIENTTPSDAAQVFAVDINGVTLTDGYYSVQQNTLEWLNTNLKEGVDNTANARSFVLGRPTHNFAIIPIYQGNAGMCWELHMVDKGNNRDYKLWQKSQGISYQMDYSQTGGEEFIYRANNWEGGDQDLYKVELAGGDSYRLRLERALPDFDSKNNVSLFIEVPAGAYFKGDITNADDVGTFEDRFQIEVDNRSGAAPLRKEFKLVKSSYRDKYDIKDQAWWPKKSAAYGLAQTTDISKVILRSHQNDGCKISTDAADRIKIYTQYPSTSNPYKPRVYLDNPWDVTHLTGNTVDRKNVHAKPIVINKNSIEGEVYLYLKITQSNGEYAAVGTCQRSDEGMMVALPITGDGVPTNIGRNKYMIIGCEDSANTTTDAATHQKASDWDINDIVFLIVGQEELPEVKEIYSSKRYMIEDLGGTYDFDFNDIVVDVTRYDVKNSAGEHQRYEDFATIRHLCGTIPFQVKVGNTVFPVVDDPTDEEQSLQQLSGNAETFGTRAVNWNPDVTKQVEGYDPDQNNISVIVWPQGKTSIGSSNPDNLNDNFTDFSSFPTDLYGGKVFRFPDNGDYPYIIAVDPSVEWMPETVSIPSSWFRTWPKQYYDWNDEDPENNVINNVQDVNVDEFGTPLSFGLNNEYGVMEVKAENLNNGANDVEVTIILPAGISLQGCKIDARSTTSSAGWKQVTGITIGDPNSSCVQIITIKTSDYFAKEEYSNLDLLKFDLPYNAPAGSTYEQGQANSIRFFFGTK